MIFGAIMLTSSTLKLSLLFICILLHFFNGAGPFYSHTFSDELNIFNNEEINFHDINAKISFFARIAGDYYLGKAADSLDFFKTMKIICIGYIFVSLLLAFFDTLDSYKSDALLCLAHSFLSFLRWSSFILPTIYVFQHYKKADRHKLSSITWTAAILGIMFANSVAVSFLNLHHFNWYVIYLTSSILSFMLYDFIETLPEIKNKKSEEAIITKQAILLAFLLAGICGAGITYQYYFVEHYFTEVMIIHIPGQQVIYSPFWITLLLTFVPAAKVTKNLKNLQIIQLSLIGILVSV